MLMRNRGQITVSANIRNNCDPTPVLLDFTEQRYLFFNLFLIGEVTFLIAIYVLGADWWERVRKVFVWQRHEH
jgi:hypothetical protein